MAIAIKDLLSGHMKKTAVGRQLEANIVLHATEGVVRDWFTKERQARVEVKSEYFKQGTVFMSVYPPPAAEEVRLQHAFFIDAMNNALGKAILKRIHIFVKRPSVAKEIAEPPLSVSPEASSP